MKRFSLFVFSVLALQGVQAADRTQGQLISIAGNVLESNLNMAITPTRGGDNIRMLYDDSTISIAGYQKGGFVVLAKDDAFSPVLGYSSSAFDADSNNPGFQLWLKAAAQGMSSSFQPKLDRKSTRLNSSHP